jgi:formylglycine-generating enzyme required for sulfatase activity
VALSAAEIEARCKRVYDAKFDDFAKLAELAGLDKTMHFRHADWSGVSFRNSDLRGFDFTAARLHNCDFTGAIITGACFVQAELGAVLLQGRDNPRAPADMTGIANLHAARDWTEYITSLMDSKRPKRPAEPCNPRHLLVGAIFSDAPGLAPEMVVVPPGSFLIGSPDGGGGDNGDQAEEGRRNNEGPRRWITFDRPFAIGRFAVNVAEFQAFAASKRRGSKTRETQKETGQNNTHPATEISWPDAVAYCKWLNGKLALRPGTYRLPSEAEWEYCARAGTDGPFWWGSSISTTQANYNGELVYGGGAQGEFRQRIVPVDLFRPNPWGLYQVHGNVWEWCHDAYVDTLVGIPAHGMARNLEDRKLSRVLRGGSWNSDAQILRSANRDWYLPGLCSGEVGFRIARSL